MIGHLRGKILDLNDNKLIVDVNGVGYEVLISNYLSSKVQLKDNICLHIYTDVKENDISLYGFSDLLEKQVFLMLRTVKGIGSKLALSIVSLVGAAEILSIVGREDLIALQKVPGIGKKSAERLIVELREKVSSFLDSSSKTSQGLNSKIEVTGGSSFSLAQLDAAAALEKLGFSKEQASAALEKASQELKNSASGSNAQEDSSKLLRISLAKLS